MAHALRFHGLLTAPRGRHGYGIYWLRLYGDGESRVAVVTEVPGNPGQTVMNASEAIVEEVERRFEIDAATLTAYLVMPSGFTGSARKSWQLHVAPELRWDEVDVADIEDAVGQRLAPLPSHAALFEGVLSVGGDADDELYEPVYERVPVGDLPPPHLPFKCALANRFESIKAETRDEVGTAAVGDRFIGSLTPEDRAACEFHAADWRSIADESVRILETLPSADREALAGRARSSALPTAERRWLASLFLQPVVVHADSYGDGQHRGCALRFSGAKEAVVVREFRAHRAEPGVWIYGDDG